ncbi:MAG: bifunctional glutamate N-acetyltransferase/amino-acid acetyltransferase ArgJ [Proteobacteria bacterium]|nr:bifunctional glutamate N-acetyltransferase/amino-acid acetyltransferase ArgJ [Pseudomonadota bacterium]
MKMVSAKLTVPGFQFAAVKCGIKYENRLDLGLAWSEVPASVAGAFTTNLIKAAPVVISQKRIRSGMARALLVNSGYANACTGRQGYRDADLLTSELARILGAPAGSILIASTGTIGMTLPVKKMMNSLPALVQNLSPKTAPDFIQSILTTDTFPKVVYTRKIIGGKKITLFGTAKGAGMIMPNMATMLGFVFTDLAIPSRLLQPIFTAAVEESFNRITVDGDTSTNDTALCLANGLAGNAVPRGRSLSQVESLIGDTLKELARMIVRDGEGGTKLVEIRVEGARNPREADLVARTIANSPLVKTAIYGAEPNWGRIIAAAGRQGSKFKFQNPKFK